MGLWTFEFCIFIISATPGGGECYCCTLLARAVVRFFVCILLYPIQHFLTGMLEAGLRVEEDGSCCNRHHKRQEGGGAQEEALVAAHIQDAVEPVHSQEAGQKASVADRTLEAGALEAAEV